MDQGSTTIDVLDVKRVPVGLIINSRSRKGAEFFKEAKHALEAAKVNITECFTLNNPSELPEKVRKLCQQGIKAIVVGGGDGTMSCIANLLANLDVTVGVLPLGTANDFARSLCLPEELEEACRLIGKGLTTRIDLGQVNGTYYVNVASIGLGSAVVENISHDTKKILGPLAYPLATAKAVMDTRPFKVRLIFPDKIVEKEAIHVAVANGRYYGGGVVVSPGAQIDNGELIVTLFEPMNPLEMGEVGLQLHTGNYVNNPKVQIFRAVTEVRLEIDGEIKQPLNVDGELSGETPAEFKLAAKAFKVFVADPSAPKSKEG